MVGKERITFDRLWYVNVMRSNMKDRKRMPKHTVLYGMDRRDQYIDLKFAFYFTDSLNIPDWSRDRNMVIQQMRAIFGILWTNRAIIHISSSS